MTPGDTPAAAANPDFDQARPSADVSRTRFRAAVMRSGGAPARRTPTIGFSGSNACGARSTILKTMPRGVSV